MFIYIYITIVYLCVQLSICGQLPTDGMFGSGAWDVGWGRGVGVGGTGIG